MKGNVKIFVWYSTYTFLGVKSRWMMFYYGNNSIMSANFSLN